MADKFDFKKEFKDLYMPKNKPALIEIPAMNFIFVDGKGDPNGKEYENAVSIVYALSYTIKMSKMSGNQPDEYFEYVIPPLEGLWWVDGEKFDLKIRNNWLWSSMIRQPDFVTQDMFDWAVHQCKRKKPEICVEQAGFKVFKEGLCVQMLHTGPYAEEPTTVEIMGKFMTENNLVDETGNERKHHEIYLSDPRKTAPEKLKTILRHPVK